MINNISISKLTVEDVKPLVQMIIKDKNEQDRSISDEQQELITSQLTVLIENCNPLTLIAKENNDIIGYINGHIIPFPLIMGKECYISCLLVNSENRGNKIGHQLMNEIEKVSKKLGCSRLILNNPKTAESYQREFHKKEEFIERTNELCKLCKEFINICNSPCEYAKNII